MSQRRLRLFGQCDVMRGSLPIGYIGALVQPVRESIGRAVDTRSDMMSALLT